MLAYLRGKIIFKNKNYIILQVDQLGYKVFLNEKLFNQLQLDQETELYTHQYVREDALDLYGFANLEQLSFFESLLSISGIGPKSALSATSVAGVEEFKHYISRGDSTLLQQVSGIGKKTAERIVVELRDKIDFLPQSRGGSSPVGSGSQETTASADEIDALMALGYSMTQARDALNRVDSGIKNSGQRIREALRNIGH